MFLTSKVAKGIRKPRVRRVFHDRSSAHEEVHCEFKRLMLKRTTLSRNGASSSVAKMLRYNSMLFVGGIVECRDDFFKSGARETAYAYYKKVADEKFEESDNKEYTSDKYARNFVLGFDKYVALVAEEELETVSGEWLCGLLG